jgi:hypothetical protein
MAHWSKIGKDPPRKLLGNRVFALLLLHLVLLAHASLAQSVYTMNSLPVSSEGWSLPGRPTMPPYLGGVQQMAYDHLSIPAMSAECERVFSDTKLTISPNRNRLKEDIIEATECLVQWTRAGW